MHLLNIKYPISPSWELDGISLVDLFKDPVNVNIRKKPIGWKQGRASAWMDNRWKLVTNSKNCRHMGRGACNPALFDIENDPFETIDVKQQHQDVFNRMKNQLNQWLHSVNRSTYHDSQCKILRDKLTKQ